MGQELNDEDDMMADALAAYNEVAEKSGADPVTPVTEKPAAAASTTEKPVKDDDDQTKDDDQNGSTPGSRKLYPGRRADGKFAKKDDPVDDKTAVVDPATKVVDPAKPATVGADGKPTEPAAAVATPNGPPPSFSVKTKADWNNLPQHVRDDIIKREGETANGLAALKDFKDLKPWAEMAGKHGTTIDAALKNYTGIENMLRTDVFGGLKKIAENMGLNQAQAAALFTDAGKRLGQGVAAPKPAFENPNNDPLIEALRPIMEPLMTRVNQIDQRFVQSTEQQRTQQTQQQQQTQMTAIETAFTAFAADTSNKYLPDLQDTMTKLLETGMVPLTGNHAADLKAAYETAAQMHPEVREALIEQRLAEQDVARRKKDQEAADKAKNASRSITGNRIPGTQIREPVRHDAQDDIEDDVRRAYASARRT